MLRVEMTNVENQMSKEIRMHECPIGMRAIHNLYSFWRLRTFISLRITNLAMNRRKYQMQFLGFSP